MPPAKGCPIPHSRFWMANAIENTSRPQCCSCDIGVRKKPSEERGPKAIIAIRQPQATTTAGVRHPTDGASVVTFVDIQELSGAIARGTYRFRWGPPKRIFVIPRICAMHG